jgi:hypothetical protein
MPPRPKESEERIARRQRDARRVVAALRVVYATLRPVLHDPNALLSQLQPISPPFVFALWHRHVALTPLCWSRLFPPGRPLTALVSASGDGEVLAGVMQAFGIRAARGSTSRGGAEALRVLARAIRDGSDVAITPDGPRGPRGVVAPGAVALAQLTGAPLVAVRIEVPWSVRVRTWDRMTVPLPFATARLVLGEPRVIPRTADPAREAERLATLLGPS